MYWAAGFNIPGYLPNFTEEFNNFEDAKDFLITVLEQERENQVLDQQEYEIYVKEMQDIKNWRKREFNSTLLMPDAHVYFIHEIG